MVMPGQIARRSAGIAWLRGFPTVDQPARLLAGARGLLEEAEVGDIARPERRFDQTLLQAAVEILLDGRVAHPTLDPNRCHDLLVDCLGRGRRDVPLADEQV